MKAKAKKAKYRKVEFAKLRIRSTFYMFDPMSGYRPLEANIKVAVCSGFKDGKLDFVDGALHAGVVWLMSPDALVWVRVK